MGLSLHQHGHSHSGHSHGGHNDTESGLDDDLKGERTKRNINVRAAFIHVLGDFIQSIGVFIAALIVYFKVLFETFSDTYMSFIFPLFLHFLNVFSVSCMLKNYMVLLAQFSKQTFT